MHLKTQSSRFWLRNYTKISQRFLKKLYLIIWQILPPKTIFSTLDEQCEIKSMSKPSLFVQKEESTEAVFEVVRNDWSRYQIVMIEQWRKHVTI